MVPETQYHRKQGVVGATSRLVRQIPTTWLCVCRPTKIQVPVSVQVQVQVLELVRGLVPVLVLVLAT